ncbi:MAG: 50S ribosomal protein L13 [Bacteroidetes bacterium 4572_112]|nr:MAG: 50S ribosomal protein L13 [Bacteroidetes bacterium 4572_112]
MEPTARITKSFRKEDVKRDWWVVDAEGKTVGRIATQIAIVLRGKNKPWFTPHVDTGDYVIVINAEKAVFQGKRADQKTYISHSGYPGRQKVRNVKDIRASHPEIIMEHAVRLMLPKNRLGRQIYKKLKVYAGPNHQHEAQQPQELIINA